MLSKSVAQDLGISRGAAAVFRQNRRTPLLEAALEPARHQFTPASLDTLIKALSLIVGTEAMIVFKDVLQLSDADAQKVKRWTIRALIAQSTTWTPQMLAQFHNLDDRLSVCGYGVPNLEYATSCTRSRPCSPTSTRTAAPRPPV